MDLQIRPISEDEFLPYMRAIDAAFSETASDEDIERERRMAEVDRCFAAFDGPEIVGTAAAFTMPMTVPGAEIEIGLAPPPAAFGGALPGLSWYSILHIEVLIESALASAPRRVFISIVTVPSATAVT